MLVLVLVLLLVLELVSFLGAARGGLGWIDMKWLKMIRMIHPTLVQTIRPVDPFIY